MKSMNSLRGLCLAVAMLTVTCLTAQADQPCADGTCNTGCAGKACKTHQSCLKKLCDFFSYRALPSKCCCSWLWPSQTYQPNVYELMRHRYDNGAPCDNGCNTGGCATGCSSCGQGCSHGGCLKGGFSWLFSKHGRPKTGCTTCGHGE